MKLNELILVLALSLSSTACSSLLDTPDLSGPDFTNDQAVSKMEDTVKAHAALQNTTPGALKTVCAYDGSIQEDEIYHCTTFVKESMIVLYADCTTVSCEATGYDKVEKSDE